MEDIISSKRHGLKQNNQNTFHAYFDPEKKEDILYAKHEEYLRTGKAFERRDRW